MENKHKQNALELIVPEMLKKILSLRFDMCVCPKCRQEMKRIILEQMPPVLAAPEQIQDPHFLAKVQSKKFQQLMQVSLEAVELVARNSPHATEDDKEKWFDKLLEMINKNRGLDFTQYHRSILKRRVAIRIKACNLDSYREYIKKLNDEPSEYSRLFEALTINVSEFFRDIFVWQGIRKLLQLMEPQIKSQKKPLKFWSAGCARGEEPYSLAILIKQMGLEDSVKVYASDVSRDNIVAAKEGVYVKRRLKNLPYYFLDKYFEPYGENKFKINNEIKQMVDFFYHDLVTDKIFDTMDMVICRNVFIYFTKPLQERVLSKFYDCLGDKKCLVIGLSETIMSEANFVFMPVDMSRRIYVKNKLAC
jgi:chemotaxis methyl-accepting protein methylase